MTWDTLQWILGIGLFVLFLMVMMRGCGGMMRGGMGGCGMGSRMERGGRGQHDEHAAATTYTCPMHPEIKQDKPGTCPKCGMALVPQR